MLEKVESAQKKIIEKCHIIDLINRKYQDKSQKELPEAEIVAETVPN